VLNSVEQVVTMRSREAILPLNPSELFNNVQYRTLTHTDTTCRTDVGVGHQLPVPKLLQGETPRAT